MLMVAAFGYSLAPAAASAELVDTATLTSGDPNLPADLYFVQNGMIEPIGFATIEASSQPDGTQPAGSWMVHVGGGNGPNWQGDVTCLAVGGNRAVIGLDGTTSGGGMSFPFVGFIGLVDGGPPAPVPGFSFPWPYPSVFNPPDHFEFRELPAGRRPSTALRRRTRCRASSCGRCSPTTSRSSTRRPRSSASAAAGGRSGSRIRAGASPPRRAGRSPERPAQRGSKRWSALSTS